MLTRNPNAVQIGLTATPRQIECDEDTHEAKADAEVTADNLKYFGEPVYEYGLAQAMEDGYLAACEIQLAQVNLDATGLTARRHHRAQPPRTRTRASPSRAAEIAAAYEKTDFENSLLLPDRVNAMCCDLFTELLASRPERGPHQKTIIFCARDRHADDVAAAMNNLYAAVVHAKGVARKDPYAFKCTAGGSGNDALPDFRGSSSSHFIATTVELLTTGVDVPARAQHRVLPVHEKPDLLLPDDRPRHAHRRADRQADVHGLRLHRCDAAVRHAFVSKPKGPSADRRPARPRRRLHRHRCRPSSSTASRFASTTSAGIVVAPVDGQAMPVADRRLQGRALGEADRRVPDARGVPRAVDQPARPRGDHRR